jgi:hypothetical protein
MTLGRVPIPIDKAERIATALGLDPKAFLLAVLEQRHPDIDFQSLFNISYSSEPTVSRLEAIAGCSLDDLPADTISMLEEVIAARHPRRRWLAPSELQTMALIRDLRPNSAAEGLSDADRESIKKALNRP